MKKNLIKVTLFGALLLLSTGTFVGCSDYDDDIKGLQDQIDGIKTGSIANLEGQLTALKATDESLKGADAAMTASIAELEKTKDAYKAADEAIKALLGGKLDKTAFDAAVAALQAKDAEFATKLAALGTDKVDKTALEAAKAELAGKIEALKASIISMEQVKSEIKTSSDALQKQITDLTNGKIKTLEEATASNLKLINEIKSQLGTFTGTVAGLIDSKIDAALTKTMKDNIAKIAGIETNVNKILGEYLSKSAFESAKKDLYAKIKVDSVALQGQINALKDLTDKTSHASQLKALNDKLFGTGDEDKNSVAWIAAEALKVANSNTTTISTLIVNALAEDGAITTAIATAINSAMGKYNTETKSLESTLDELFGRINLLEGRIQSLVFIPQYQGSHILYFVGNNVGTLTFTFRVAPAKIATEIQKAHLSFANQVLKTRAAEAGLTITDVVGDAETGIITVKATAGADFNNSNQNAVALVLNTNPKDATKEANHNMTTEYFTVEGVAMTTTDLKFEKTAINVKYTDTKKYNISETAVQRKSDGRAIEELGFTQVIEVTKINGLVTNEENEEDIKKYLAESEFNFDKATGEISIRKNVPASINGSLNFELKDKSTGFTATVNYAIVGDGVGVPGNYETITPEKLINASVAKNTSVWKDDLSNDEQVYSLKLDGGQLNMIPGKTVQEVLVILAAATTTHKIKDVDAEISDPKLTVTNTEVLVTLPAGSEWKKYEMKTIFATNIYGDLELSATLDLSYPKETILVHQDVRWDNGKYFVEYTKPNVAVVAELTIEHLLGTGFKNVEGIYYTYELLATIPGTKPTDPKTKPIGVTVALDGTIRFTQKVDLSTVSVKVSAKAESNVVKTEEFNIIMAYPVKTTFEAMNATDLTYKKDAILSEDPFDWTSSLQLLDRYGRKLLVDGKITTANNFAAIYALEDLKFEYVSNNGNIEASYINVDETTGKLSLDSKVNLTKNVTVTIKVTATNKYGTSESNYVITLEKTY